MSKLFFKGIVATFVGALISLSAHTVFANDTIKIGVPGAHSGELASYGLPTLNAVNLVVDDINAKGGIDGKQVEIIAFDEGCKAEIATNAATKLISDGVVAIIGHTCSNAGKAVISLYNDANIIVMSPTITAPDMTLSGKNPVFFRTIANDLATSIAGAEFVVNKLNAKKVAVLHDNSEYGKGYAEKAIEYIKENGKDVEIVLYEAVTPGAADYSSVIRKVLRAKADVLMWGGYYPEASKILSNMYSLDLAIPFVGPDGLKDKGFIELAGADAEGVYASGPTDTSANPISKEYAEKHLKKYGTTPGAFFDTAVSATIALLNAIDKADSTEAKKIMDALRNNDVETAVGTIRFDDKGDAIGVGMSIYQITNGEYVEIK